MDHFERLYQYATRKLSQAIEASSKETDQEKEYRLMAKYVDREQTLTPEEHDFLRRRGLVRY